MKKLFAFGLLCAMLALAAPSPALDNRVTPFKRVCAATFADIASDQLLTIDGTSKKTCYIGDMKVKRIVLESNITAISGTNVIFKVLTHSDPTYAGATTDPALVGSDGSTAFVSATLTATGRAAKGTAVNVIGASGVTTNIGDILEIFADTTSLTDLDGDVRVVIYGD